MHVSELAGKPAPKETLVDIPRLVSAYYTDVPDPDDPFQRVSFGTSGHRGSSLRKSFNETHILAVCQAVAELRREQGVDGPLFLGMDTHALSEPALRTAVEVFAAHGVRLMLQEGLGYTPTPVVSHAILTWNAKADAPRADGVVITPSHNPPEDGGIKYNPPTGGPASPEVTKRIQERANALIRDGNREIRRVLFESALRAENTVTTDYIRPYVDDLEHVVDMAAISAGGVHIGVDPMGGAGVAYWGPIAERYSLHLVVLNPYVDPTFSFMPLDWDGKIRMDCSSAYAMTNLLATRSRFDISFGNDTDYDRHGIVTGEGLMAPNAYLAVAARYLMTRRGWAENVQIGKTLVSSSIIDRMAEAVGRTVCEVPVGFKWFVDGLLSGTFGFAGEESAGASFLRRDGTVWTTDKDGFVMDLLAAEILAVTGRSPAEHYRELTDAFGKPFYQRIDAPATPEQKTRLAKLSPGDVRAETLAGEPITARLTNAPGNGEPIGGLKVATRNGWFAARPSGTEDVYKIYAESFLGGDHLHRIQQEAAEIVTAALA